MPFPLNKVPRGLIELLRLRTLGKNPQVFDEAAQAVIDATEYYGADLIVVANTSAGAGAITRGATTTFTVPGRVHGFSGIVITGAAGGTQIRMRVEVTPVPGGSSCPLGATVITAPVAGSTYVAVAAIAKPIVALPGWSFSVQVEGDAAGADHQIFVRTLFEQYTGSP